MKDFSSILVLLLLLLLNDDSYTQSSLGLESQVYPTGIIPGLRWERNLTEKDAYHVRFGYQFIDHRDLGKHDDETGNGYGFTLGYTRQIHAKWALGFRSDLWWNSIDWRTGEEGSVSAVEGKSDIMVLQPTALLEFKLHECDHWIIAPSLAFGMEWNIKTDGEPTGEGPILLLGFKVMKKL